MEKIMNYENLRSFAYVNDAICKKPIRGIVISFFGLNEVSMFQEDPFEGSFYAERGILYVVPYNNPWAWMNRQAVNFTDEVIDVLFERFHLDDKTPIVSTGGSMGGQSALVYMVYGKRTPVACVANCPVCDVKFHYTERPDLPRTLYSAVFSEEGSLLDALCAISPQHLIDKMPRSTYHIFHCDQDQAVSISKHSEQFVEAMQQAGFEITFDVVPGRGHCDLTEEVRVLYRNYVCDAIDKA